MFTNTATKIKRQREGRNRDSKTDIKTDTVLLFALTTSGGKIDFFHLILQTKVI